MTALLAPAPCRVPTCGAPAYLADDEGPAHPCCVRWAELDPSRPCPACAASRAPVLRKKARA